MKQTLGFWAVITALIGLMFTAGGVENAQTLQEWITVAGVGFTSMMLGYMGTLMINDQI
jgi:hypothetical protein